MAFPQTSGDPSDPSKGVKADRIEVGFDGFYKVGEWTLLRLELTSPVDREINWFVEAPDSDDNRTVLPVGAVTLNGGVSNRVETCFRTGRIRGDVKIRIQDAAGTTLLNKKLSDDSVLQSGFKDALELDKTLVATLGNPPGFTAESAAGSKNARQSKSSGSSRFGDESAWVIARLESAAQLPADKRAFQSLDALVIATFQSEPNEKPLLARISDEQHEALRNWVRTGGHLVLSVGSDIAAYQQSPLAKWVPISVTGQAPVRQLNRLEIFAGRNVPLSFPGTIPSAKLGSLPRRNVFVEGTDGPLLARMPYGLGRVTFLALDLNRPPLATWPALSDVCRKLCGDSRDEGRQPVQEQRRLTHLGITDLASQLNAAQDDFDSVHRISHWLVLALILVYIVIIGPLDYLLVHRIFRRPEWTWFTFPMLVSLAGILTVWGAGRLNGDRLQVNQLDLLDFDSETKHLSGQSWVTLYSPEPRRYDVSVEPASYATPQPEATSLPQIPGVQISWNGVPENTVGGLYRAGGLGSAGRIYNYGAGARSLENLPILKWSTRSVHAAWEQETGGMAESRLETRTSARLGGTIMHRFPKPLTGCLLVFAGRVYFPTGKSRTLDAYQEWEPAGPQGRQNDLRAYLTETVQFKANPYNPLNHDRGDLVQMLTFHRSAGGANYTGLNHAALRELELTSLTHIGRAVLIGKIESPGARVSVDGKTEETVHHDTYVRIVLPVQQAQDTEERMIPKFTP